MGNVKKNLRQDSTKKQKIDVQNNKKRFMKKPLATTLIVVGGIALVWMGFVLFCNNYRSNALQMKENATVAYRLSSIILNDYLDNWIQVETEKVGKNADGLMVSTDSPSSVLKWRREFFEKNGFVGILDDLLEQIDGNYGKMNLTPAKYRDTHEAFDRLVKHVNALAKLTVTPGDSLVKMASDMNDLVKKVKDDLEASDFNFLVSYDDLKAKVDGLAATVDDTKLAEALMKDVVDKSSTAINAMKYKKMGFTDLPKGNGVLYRVVTAGKGRKPKDDTKVRLHYEGKLMDGTVFDSSYQRGQPAVMRPSQTVPGFWHSLLNMKEGAKWEIFIPNSQAYGARAAGAVKPYSDLFFTIEILGFE